MSFCLLAFDYNIILETRYLFGAFRLSPSGFPLYLFPLRSKRMPLQSLTHWELLTPRCKHQTIIPNYKVARPCASTRDIPQPLNPSYPQFLNSSNPHTLNSSIPQCFSLQSPQCLSLSLVLVLQKSSDIKDRLSLFPQDCYVSSL